MNDAKKLKSVKISRAEYLSEEDRKKHNLPDEGMIAMETWEVKTLAEQVLDKLAKELAEEYGAYKSWKEMTEGNYWACAEPVVERVVVLALSAKQAEVLKEIDEIDEFSEQLVDNKDLFLEKKLNLADVDLFFDSIEDLNMMIKDLKKRLLAKSEAKK